MKIRFLKNVTADVEASDGEIYDKFFPRWTELRVEEIFEMGTVATLKTSNRDFILAVPKDSFEKLKEEKRVVTL